jgi:hypothetical protein
MLSLFLDTDDARSASMRCQARGGAAGAGRPRVEGRCVVSEPAPGELRSAMVVGKRCFGQAAGAARARHLAHLHAVGPEPVAAGAETWRSSHGANA